MLELKIHKVVLYFYCILNIDNKIIDHLFALKPSRRVVVLYSVNSRLFFNDNLL